jgi:hypothetical protein
MPVDTKQQILVDAEDDLKLVNALWGGTKAMRDAGVLYLPKEEAEEPLDYKRRRDQSFLTNFFKKTIKAMAGRLFEDKVTVLDAPAFDSLSENVDLEGRNLHRFGYDLTKLTMRDGLRFIVVDAPTAEGVRTAAEERIAGIRPYFVEVDINNVLGWKTEDIAGQRVLTQFRYKEMVTVEVDSFSDKVIEQIRVIEPGVVTLFRKNEKGEFVYFGEIPTSVDFVPVVPVYAGRQGFMDFEPPLLDLAWLNVEHWQKSSDQSNILHVARVPILHWAGYGAEYDDQGNEVLITVGPNTLAKSKSEKAKLEYVEHSGAAIGAGRQDLIDIESRSVALGADFMTPRKSGDMTATEAAIGEAGDVSDLSALAQNIKDSLELAFTYAGRMMGSEFTGSVSLNTDLGIMTSVNIQELVKLRMAGDLSREGLFEVLNREWDTNLDVEQEAERLDMEGPSIGGGNAFTQA